MPKPSKAIIEPTEKEIELKKSMGRVDKPMVPPFEKLPCANTDKSSGPPCKSKGTLFCGECRLVAYCSAICQHEHQKTHESDCKNPMQSSDWKPRYISENRTPAFYDAGEDIVDEHGIWAKRQYEGLMLWGNIPSIDVLNLSENEKDYGSDYTLAFVSSGDLRNVIHTVNSLPEDHSGQLTILLNDTNPLITYRNIMTLLILGFVAKKDIALAVDMALHFWYSIAYPPEYQVRLQGVLAALLHRMNDDTSNLACQLVNFPLGPQARLKFMFNHSAVNIFEYFVSSSSFTAQQAVSEYTGVRMAPSREDFRERMYSGMRPSHRMAFHRYRENGLLLPFGAPSKHFSTVNSSLFSRSGSWLQGDHVDPLAGYSLEEVITSGKAHGASPEDIYGCLYFHVSDQLRKFSKRLQTLRILVHVLSEDPMELPLMIRKGVLSSHTIPTSMKFDRIDLSNIIDATRIGLEAPLKAWATLLSTKPKARLFGLLDNWADAGQRDGCVSNADRAVITSLLDQMRKDGKIPSSPCPTKAQQCFEESTDIYQPMMQALYDNSRPFEAFLKKQSLPSILKRASLVRKKIHQIAPYRLLSPPTTSASSLPQFRGDSWYTEHHLVSRSWLERYVEFTRA